MSDPLPPLCVICVVLLGRRAAEAVTLVAGDPVCVDHTKLRVEANSLKHALTIARADLA